VGHGMDHKAENPARHLPILLPLVCDPGQSICEEDMLLGGRLIVHPFEEQSSPAAHKCSVDCIDLMVALETIKIGHAWNVRSVGLAYAFKRR